MVFNQLASWLFSTSKTDTRARFHRVEKAAGPVPSCSFERSFGLYRRCCCLSGGRFGRRGVRAARRLRDFTVRRIRKIPLRSLHNKKEFLEFQFHARRKKALPLSRSTRALRVDNTPSQTKKEKMSPAAEERRSCVRLFFFCRGALRLYFATRRFRYLDLTSRPKDGGGVFCVWISVKISPFATIHCLFLPTSRLAEAFEKELALSCQKRGPTKWKMEGLFHQPTTKKACACVVRRRTKTLKRRDIFLDLAFFRPGTKDKPSPGTILKEADEDNSHA